MHRVPKLRARVLFGALGELGGRMGGVFRAARLGHSVEVLGGSLRELDWRFGRGLACAGGSAWPEEVLRSSSLGWLPHLLHSFANWNACRCAGRRQLLRRARCQEASTLGAVQSLLRGLGAAAGATARGRAWRGVDRR